jgi:hypothetical protein
LRRKEHEVQRSGPNLQPTPGPDRDTKRQYVVFGLVAFGLIAAGVLFGALDDPEARAPAAASPVATERPAPTADPAAPTTTR